VASRIRLPIAGKSENLLNFECNKADIAADNKNYAAAGCTEKAAKSCLQILRKKRRILFSF
jgi:hypothetical protein